MEGICVENGFEQEIINEELSVGLEIQEEIIHENVDELHGNESDENIDVERLDENEVGQLEEIILGGEDDGDVNSTKNEFETMDLCRNSSDVVKAKTKQELERYYNSIRCDRIVGVYVKTNAEGYIVDVKSDMFTKNLDGYIKIDEGDGDKFFDAENLYFYEPLRDEKGNFRYKL